MKKRVRLLFVLLVVIILISAVVYIAERMGVISETAMMLILLPLMLGTVCLTCVIFVEGSSDEKRDR